MYETLWEERRDRLFPSPQTSITPKHPSVGIFTSLATSKIIGGAVVPPLVPLSWAGRPQDLQDVFSGILPPLPHPSHSIHLANVYRGPFTCQKHHSSLGRSAAIPASPLTLSRYSRTGSQAGSQGCLTACQPCQPLQGLSAAGPASASALKGRPFNQVPCEPAVWAVARPAEYVFVLQAVYFLPQSVWVEEVCVSASL